MGHHGVDHYKPEVKIMKWVQINLLALRGNVWVIRVR